MKYLKSIVLKIVVFVLFVCLFVCSCCCCCCFACAPKISSGINYTCWYSLLQCKNENWNFFLFKKHTAPFTYPIAQATWCKSTILTSHIIIYCKLCAFNLRYHTGDDNSNKACFERTTKFLQEYGNFAGNREGRKNFRET